MFGLKIVRNARCMKTNVRCFGITDRIMGFAQDKMEGTKEEQFKKMIEGMVASKTWNLMTWKNSLEKQLSSWMMYVPGMSSSDEVKTVKNFKAILDKLTPSEMTNPDLINSIVRERVARSSGQSVDDVAKMLYAYKQTKMMALWLQMKHANGEPLPQTDIELQIAQEGDPRVKKIAQSIFMPKGKKKAGRGQGMPY